MFYNTDDVLRAACLQAGVDYKPVPRDGRFHVADISNDSRGKNDARIQITQDGQRVQAFNYKSGERVQLFLNAKGQTAAMSDAEKQRIEKERRKREIEEAKRKDRAGKRALAI